MPVVKQGCKANVVLDTLNGTIDGMTKTVVFFLLQTGS